MASDGVHWSAPTSYSKHSDGVKPQAKIFPPTAVPCTLSGSLVWESAVASRVSHSRPASSRSITLISAKLKVLKTSRRVASSPSPSV